MQRVYDYDRLDMFTQTELLEYGGDEKVFTARFGGKAENYLDVAYDYMSAGYCFPARNDDIAVLKYAMSIYPEGDNAPYYLGCLYYDKFDYETAIGMWERAIEQNPAHEKAFRNLALAYFDKRGDFLSAKICMEKALENKPDDSRLLLEYQQLLKNMNDTPEHRMAVYDKYYDLMMHRDDCYLDRITLLCMIGEYKKAIEMARNRHFHIYEGGEGKLTKLHAWIKEIL